MFKKILFPVDLDHRNSCKKAISVAKDMVSKLGAELYVINVVPDSGINMVINYLSQDKIDEILSDIKENLNEFTKEHFPEIAERTQKIVKTGTVYEVIIETAREIDADLIVMQSHRPELKDYLLGPNAARVVRHYEKSVLVVRD